MIIELKRMAPTGEAIGHHEGLILFVPFGLPGDLVEVEVTVRRTNYARARITRIIRPSPERIIPPCRYFGSCGGCEWQHIPYEQQLAYKAVAVREQFIKVGKFGEVEVQPCIGSPDRIHYRNHTQLVLSEDGRPGYYRASSHSLVEIEECLVVSPAINAMIARFQEIRATHSAQSGGRTGYRGTGVREVHLRTGINTGNDAAYYEHGEGVISEIIPSVIHERIGGYLYQISPASFFQINTALAELLVDEVLDQLNPLSHEAILDLYSGVGLFTLPISMQSRYIIGVESNSSATQDAIVNLRDRTNARIINASVEEALDDPELDHPWDAILVDPPRTGINRDSLHKMIGLNAHRITYVSCDPATLARDARLICEGGYTLNRIQPLDMFPQTHHVETVALFKRQVDADTR